MSVRPSEERRTARPPAELDLLVPPGGDRRRQQGRSAPPLGPPQPAAVSLRRDRVRRLAAAAAYLGLARHLPWSPRPGGRVARALRAALAARMLDACGEDVNVEHGAWFGSGNGIRLGARSALGMDVLVLGPLHVGEDVMMGPRCVLVASSHETGRSDVPINQQGFAEDRPIVIEDGAWLGACVVVLPGRRIGAHSVVGAGAVVSRDVPPYAVVGGNPARVLRWRTADGRPPATREAERSN